MSLFEDIFDSGESRVIGMSRKIIEYAIEANMLLEKMIAGEDNVTKIKIIERSADKEVFMITNSIVGGAIAPNIIDDMLLFINKEDDIIDNIFNLSRELKRYRCKKRRMASIIKKSMEESAKLNDRSLSLLLKMHKTDLVWKINKLMLDIESIEEDGDVIKDSMFSLAYKTDMNFKDFYHMMEVGHIADDILDSCRDSSNMLMSIMSSIIS